MPLLAVLVGLFSVAAAAVSLKTDLGNARAQHGHERQKF